MNKYKKFLNSFKRKEDVLEKTYIITGANSGLGFSTTKHLISVGAKVVMACRSQGRAEKAREELLKIYPEAHLDILLYDQADFNSIQQFAENVKLKYNNFSGLVLNAGIFHPQKGLKTKQDFPLTVGTNYLGVFYLLKKLEEVGLWEEQIERRIILIGSLAWKKIERAQINEILTKQNYKSFKEYSHSKTLIGTLAYNLSRHQEDVLSVPNHVKVLLMHPGVSSTNIVASSQGSYPKWFSRLAKRALNLFVHSPDKASLGTIKLLLKEDVTEEMISVPRGLFHISGYPKLRRYPKKLKKIDNELLNLTNEIINNS